MEAVIVKNSPVSVLWKLFVEHIQLVAVVLLLSHNVWWWFMQPTVLTTVTYCALTALMAGIEKRRWLVWAWILLMLFSAALHAAMLSPTPQAVVAAKPIVVFCGNCEQ